MAHRVPFLVAELGADVEPFLGGDLSKRLRAGSLSLSNGRQDTICMSLGPSYPVGVDGGAGVG